MDTLPTASQCAKVMLGNVTQAQLAKQYDEMN